MKTMFSPYRNDSAGLGWDYDECPKHTRFYNFADRELKFEGIVGVHETESGSHYLKLENGREFAVSRRWFCVESIDE